MEADYENLCRLCLRVLGPDEASFKQAHNPALKETIVTLLGGQEAVCQCEVTEAEGASSCNRQPRVVCVQCKLDLEFCMEFAARARRINERLTKMDGNAGAGSSCGNAKKLSADELYNFQDELMSSFGSLYSLSISDQHAKVRNKRLVRSIRPKDDSSCKLNEVLTKKGKVAIPPLRPAPKQQQPQSKPDNTATLPAIRPKPSPKSVEIEPRVFQVPASSVQDSLAEVHHVMSDDAAVEVVVMVEPTVAGDSEPKEEGGSGLVSRDDYFDPERGVYACKWPGCGKTWKNSSYLVDHERVHRGEKPFACKTCLKSFYRISDMKKHRLLKACKTKTVPK